MLKHVFYHRKACCLAGHSTVECIKNRMGPGSFQVLGDSQLDCLGLAGSNPETTSSRFVSRRSEVAFSTFIAIEII